MSTNLIVIGLNGHVIDLEALLRWSDDHHRDLPARRPTALSSRSTPSSDQNRHIMIKVGARQNCRALFRRSWLALTKLARAAHGIGHLVVRSPSRDAACAHRNRRLRSSSPRPLRRQAFNTPRQHTTVEIPIESDARPFDTFRGFLPLRLSDAGPGVRGAITVAAIRNPSHRQT